MGCIVCDACSWIGILLPVKCGLVCYEVSCQVSCSRPNGVVEHLLDWAEKPLYHISSH
uniref:Uncharacterized protein n=1 Tax=Anguilla anguilla TaxID=7936 RepID=A0A0E9PQE7_ANGAN